MTVWVLLITGVLLGFVGLLQLTPPQPPPPNGSERHQRAYMAHMVAIAEAGGEKEYRRKNIRLAVVGWGLAAIGFVVILVR